MDIMFFILRIVATAFVGLYIYKSILCMMSCCCTRGRFLKLMKSALKSNFLSFMLVYGN